MANNYWEKRETAEKEWIKREMRSDADFNNQLQSMSQDSLKEINKTIDEFYMKYASANGLTKQQAMQQVAAEDVKTFSSKAKKMVKDKDFSKAANDQLKLYNATMRINRLEMLKAEVGAQLVELGNQQQVEMQKKFTADYLDEIKRQAGILGQDRNEDLIGRVNAVVNGSWQKAVWSDRLWNNITELQATIGIQLNRFMVQGLNPRVIARNLKPLLSDTVTSRTAIAERLARTETARVQDTAEMDMFKKYNIKQVKWVAEPSACSICTGIASRNDGIYNIEDVPMIPAHPNCRCAKAAYVDGDMNLIVPEIAEEQVIKPTEFTKKMSSSNIKDWFNQGRGNLDDWSAYLQANKLDGTVQNYTGGLFAPLNTYLRTDKKNVFSGQTKKGLEKSTANLDKAINEFALDKPITVYRNVDDAAFKDLDLNDIKPDSLYTDKGYMSTSVLPKSFGGSGDINMEITVPSGKGNGAYINQQSQFKDTEYEFVLPRGSELQITSAKKRLNKWTVKAVLVPKK